MSGRFKVISRRSSLGAGAAIAVTALVLTGCTSTTGGNEGGEGEALTIGTTDKVTALDPAGAYDNGSFFVSTQVYPFLMSYKPGSAEVEPGIAESAEYSSDTEYTVKLKDGLKFSNGNELTSSDVKFSYDRQKKINDPNGPASLLGALESVEAPDDTTVVFKLNRPTDQTFPLVLAGPAGPVVDEDSFSPDKLTTDDEIVKADAFGGPYKISSFKLNQLVSYQANPDYVGNLGEAKSAQVDMTYYSDANNMKLDVQQGTIDVAWRALTATDIESLEGDDNVKVEKGPGGEIRYLVYNFDTMPFGAKTDDADPKKSLAVRQAMADSVDREAIAEQIYKGTYTPLYSYVPDGLPGANESLKGAYGDGNGGPDVAKAKKVLEDAGIDTPVKVSMQYSPDHYGPSSGDEYAAVKDQLEKDGLFTIDLKSTEWVQYSEDRVNDVYPTYQLGWYPDYADADNYLVPFFLENDEYDSFLGNKYQNDDVNKRLIDQSSIADKAEREKALGEIQDELAKDVPTLPLLQGEQIAVSGKDVKGVADTLDPSFTFRLALLSK